MHFVFTLPYGRGFSGPSPHLHSDKYAFANMTVLDKISLNVTATTSDGTKISGAYIRLQPYLCANMVGADGVNSFLMDSQSNIQKCMDDNSASPLGSTRLRISEGITQGATLTTLYKFINVTGLVIRDAPLDFTYVVGYSEDSLGTLSLDLLFESGSAAGYMLVVLRPDGNVAMSYSAFG